MRFLFDSTVAKSCMIAFVILAGCTQSVDKPSSTTVEELIERYEMTELMDGIYIAIDYRSSDTLRAEQLDPRYSDDHVYLSSIYYLITPKAKDSFHRLKSDETWHWYEGDPVKLTKIDENGGLEEVVLGEGRYQHTVRAGTWYFSSQIGNSYSLVGLVVVPGFEDSDFTPGNREVLVKRYPEHEQLIIANTED